jgi:hypothetical protein
MAMLHTGLAMVHQVYPLAPRWKAARVSTHSSGGAQKYEFIPPSKSPQTQSRLFQKKSGGAGFGRVCSFAAHGRGGADLDIQGRQLFGPPRRRR